MIFAFYNPSSDSERSNFEYRASEFERQSRLAGGNQNIAVRERLGNRESHQLVNVNREAMAGRHAGGNQNIAVRERLGNRESHQLANVNTEAMAGRHAVAQCSKLERSGGSLAG